MTDDSVRAKAERNVLPKIGASFFLDPDGEVLFQYVADASSVIGPRPATEADKASHAGAWAAFLANPEAAGLFNGADPAAFDHDGDGRPGGSVPKPRRGRKSKADG